MLMFELARGSASRPVASARIWRALVDFELGAQPVHHGLGHEFGQALAIAGDFLDQMRGGEEQLGVGEQEDGLDVALHLLVHMHHLELVVEVGNGAEAADNDTGADALGVIDQEAAKLVDAGLGLEVPDTVVDQLDALVKE